MSSIRIYKATGGFSWELLGDDFLGHSATGGQALPSYEEAKAMGMEWFSRLGLDEISADNIRVGPSGYNELGATGLIVANRIWINDRVVEGQKYSIRICPGSVVWHAAINPIKYELGEKIPLKSIEEAYEEMKARKEFYAPRIWSTKKVVIDNIYLAYWLEPMNKSQEYIAPVYVFDGQCLDASGNEIHDPMYGKLEGYVDHPFRAFVSAAAPSSSYKVEMLPKPGVPLPEDLTFDIAIP
jgi:hypothetical protein